MRERLLQLVECLGISTRMQGVLTLIVIVLIPVYVLAGWLDSIAALAIVTLLTWLDGRWNAWIGSRVARKQVEDADVQEVKDLIEERVPDEAGT